MYWVVGAVKLSRIPLGEWPLCGDLGGEMHLHTLMKQEQLGRYSVSGVRPAPFPKFEEEQRIMIPRYLY